MKVLNFLIIGISEEEKEKGSESVFLNKGWKLYWSVNRCLQPCGRLQSNSTQWRIHQDTLIRN
jgi:hypothetical protein